MIVVNNLTKKYKSPVKDEFITALDDVSLFLPDKGFISVVGASGCGKSTLLNMLGGLDVPNSGSMIVNGRDTSSFRTKDWNSYRNQEVGFIFQNYFLMPHLNVYENIAITLQMSKQGLDVKERVKEALHEVEMDGFEKRLPKTLSGGQQQRVAIARALIAKPSIILADEPTGALDKKSSIGVMESLKRISKEHLVVMVTHNDQLAKKYSDRIIEISYGKIVEDKVIKPESDDIVCNDELKKVHIPFKTKVKWSLRNVYKKKSRSIPIAIASGFGLACVGLVISMTKSVNDYSYQAQKNAIKDYPVYVNCSAVTSSEGQKEKLIKFPDTTDIIVEKTNYQLQEYYPIMKENFIKYLDDMPIVNYSHRQSNVVVNLNMLTTLTVGETTSYLKVSPGSYTTCIANDTRTYPFIEDQYSVLAGHLPQSDTDLTLVLDTYNRVDAGVLASMGFDTSNDILKAEDILEKKEYRIIGNDDMYMKNKVNSTTGLEYYSKKGSSSYKSLYENNSIKNLKITGIVRPKSDSSFELYGSVLLYHPNLIKDGYDVMNNIKNSGIVKEQLEQGLNCDMTTGAPFVDSYSGSYHLSANYNYESRLYDIGYTRRITSVYYFTDTFEQRADIDSYVKKYKVAPTDGIRISTKDYLQTLSEQFSSLVEIFSTILIIFSCISVLVSTILTAILTYISVLERKREIGLLRSLGSQKRDVSFVFIIEQAVIGLFGSLIGIILCYSFAPLVANVLVGVIKMAGSSVLVPTASNFSSIQPWLIPAMMGLSLIISILAALIPALIAGNKKPADALRE